MGFEIFPALCTCASRTVNELKRCIGGSSGYGNNDNEYNDNYSHHFNGTSQVNGNNNHDSYHDNNYYDNNNNNMSHTNNSKHVRYGTNTNTINEKRTYDGVRAGTDMLAVAAASLPAGLPLIEVR